MRIEKLGYYTDYPDTVFDTTYNTMKELGLTGEPESGFNQLMGYKKQSPILVLILTTTLVGFGFHQLESSKASPDIPQERAVTTSALAQDKIFVDRKNPKRMAFNFKKQNFYATLELESPDNYFMDVHPERFSGFEKTDKIVKRYALNPVYKDSLLNSFLRK